MPQFSTESKGATGQPSAGRRHEPAPPSRLLRAVVITARVVAVDESVAVIVDLVFARGADQRRATGPAPLRTAKVNAARIIAVDESIAVVVSEV